MCFICWFLINFEDKLVVILDECNFLKSVISLFAQCKVNSGFNAVQLLSEDDELRTSG